MKKFLSILIVCFVIGCNETFDYNQFYWGMSQPSVNKIMQGRSIEVYPSKNSIQYVSEIDGDEIIFEFEFIDNKLGLINIDPVRSKLRSQEDCLKMKNKITAILYSELGPPIDEYDSEKDKANPLRFKSYYAVYNKGKTSAVFRFLDHGPAILIGAVVGRNERIYGELREIYGIEFLSKRKALDRLNQ